MSVGQMHILGIDVAKVKLDAALLLPDGKFRSEVVANTPEGFKKLAAWLERNSAAQVHACMEATGIYWEAAAAFLAEQGHAVSVVNPAQISAFGSAALSRTKTDRKDARLIARFCAEPRPPLWEPPPPEMTELRAVATIRDALERMRTQEMNRLHVSCAEVRTGIERHLAFLEREIKDIGSEIRQKTDGDTHLKKQLQQRPQKAENLENGSFLSPQGSLHARDGRGHKNRMGQKRSRPASPRTENRRWPSSAP